ncbi:MAG: arginase [Chlorobi bacterium]|jgi:arginase|nr:MAG: arginase [Ignavibacterium sp.]MBL1155101.1 arginase [Ignavibacteriota bacterium]MBL1161214.1 arginase [Chlorobiota bacterium]MCO6447457.1 arginase [Ignavibacterium album]MCZ2267374.1 arginase [Ignavibacteriales bacterium]MDX9713335.1 arginase [Ignavibacteriaceae bacterium]
MIKQTEQIVSIIGFPVDLGAGRRGVDMGPSALRIAGLESKLRALGYKVEDTGDINIEIMERQKIINPKLKYLNEILKTSRKLAARIEKVLEQNKFPLCLGGDHSMALGTLAGISSYCRKNNLTLGVIWIDAHADMNTDETTPSGNIHGMPLAASMGLGHPELVDFYGFAPKLKPENCTIIAARSIDIEEREIIKKLNPAVYTMSDVDKLGIHRIISRVLKQFKEKIDHIHVSFDVDSVDPNFAPGVGTPVPGGLNYREAHLLMESIAECGCMSSLGVAEVNPILDVKNSSAVFAADLIASSMGQRIL